MVTEKKVKKETIDEKRQANNCKEEEEGVKGTTRKEWQERGEYLVLKIESVQR